MLVSVIIPTFGQWQLTKQCLLSLKKHTQLPIEIVLINNAVNVLKDDETHEEAPHFGKKLFGENFVYLPQESNLNFAGACNLGAKMARTKLLFFLNNDTEVTENWLLPLLEDFSQSDAHKMLAPLLLFPPDDEGLATIQHIGVYYTGLQVGHIYTGFPANHRIAKRKTLHSCITAAAFLISKEDFFSIDGYDEGFINGFEDVDFCIRFTQKHKKTELAVLPQSKIYHYCSMSQGRSDKEIHNSKRLYAKHSKQFFTPNYHSLLIRDGYQLKINALLEFNPQLNERHKSALLPLLEKNDKEEIKKALQKEPFWDEGFFALLTHPEVDAKEIQQLFIKQITRSPNQEVILKAVEYFIEAEEIPEQMLSFISNISSNTDFSKHKNQLAEYKHIYKHLDRELYTQLDELDRNYDTSTKASIEDYRQRVRKVKEKAGLL